MNIWLYNNFQKIIIKSVDKRGAIDIQTCQTTKKRPTEINWWTFLQKTEN